MSLVGGARLIGVATSFVTVDDYISGFPLDVQKVLSEIRRTMHAAVPGAGETISYNLPTLTLNGRSLVYFAGWKRHVSVYPIPDGDGDDDYETALASFRSGASTAKFMLAKPVPFDLIGRITSLLAAEQGTPPASSKR
ncbi:MAG: DUF1801 domain-containing protein [Ilumatobacteraceae bacterium]